MPGYGDHYKASTGIAANPFEEKPPTLTEYTAKELATLQSRLDKQLGPEFISSRPGAGGAKVHYITAEKVINLANQVFGFNGWSSQIREITPDFVDEAPGTGKITLGLSVIVRVTLRDGTYHEDVGYGHIENCKGKAAAFEKAKKEAATDALKRALRTFGNVLGNCLYDKDYLGKVTKIKIAPSKWDGEKLHRHPDFAPIKNDATPETEIKEHGVSAPNENAIATVANTENEDEFGGDVFDEVDLAEGHPDEVILPPEKPVTKQTAHNAGPNGPETPRRSAIQPSDIPPQHVDTNKSSSDQSQQHQQSRPPFQTNHQQVSNPPQTSHITSTRPQTNRPNPPQGGTTNDSRQSPAPQLRNQETSVGFTTSRAADLLTSDNQPPNVPLPPFNPKAESQSIRRTSGVNHATSEPIKRQAIGSTNPQAQKPNAPSAQASGPDTNASLQRVQQSHIPSTTNFVNPAADTSRRIGMPNGAGSPIAHSNRNAYRPPGPAAQKRSYAAAAGAEDANSTARRPLADVSNTIAAQGQGVAAADAAADDAKRLKIADGSHG